MVKTKTKIRTCIHCGHTFDVNDQRRDVSDPEWLPLAAAYCSHECSDQFHCAMGHCCSAHTKDKARREAAKAAKRER